MKIPVFAFVLLFVLSCRGAIAGSPEGWTKYAPRDELLPEFSFAIDEHSNQQGGALTLKIAAGDRDAIDGAWVTTIPVMGGNHYRFSALRRTVHPENSLRP